MAKENADGQVDGQVDETIAENQENETATGSQNLSQNDANEGGDNAAVEFDPAAYEAAFGMDPGSLAGAKTSDEAVKMVQEQVDAKLVAGLTSTPAYKTTAGVLGGVDDTGNVQKADSGSKTPESPTVEQLHAELVEVKTKLAAQEKAVKDQRLSAIDRAVTEEIDSWASATYGVGSQRNFKQLQNTEALRKQLAIHANGMAASGEKLPDDWRPIVRRVRAFHDPNFVLDKKVDATQTEKPLGTPGGKKAGSDTSEGPRNIHDALSNSPVM